MCCKVTQRVRAGRNSDVNMLSEKKSIEFRIWKMQPQSVLFSLITRNSNWIYKNSLFWISGRFENEDSSISKAFVWRSSDNIMTETSRSERTV